MHGLLARRLEPFDDVLVNLAQHAVWQTSRCITGGKFKPTEKANILAGWMRTGAEFIEDSFSPMIKLFSVQNESDYLRFDLGEDRPFAVRWSKSNNTTRRIGRNNTGVQTGIQTQGKLFGSDDGEELPALTLRLDLEDDFVVGGVPQVWVGRLVLVREAPEWDEVEFLREVRAFERPAVTPPHVFPRNAQAADRVFAEGIELVRRRLLG